MADFIWQSAAATEAGKKRSINQDAFLSRPEHRLWAVADGMGGHKAGEIASAKIISSLQALNSERALGSAVNEIYHRLAGVNQDLLDIAANGGEYEVIGSTVVVLLACNRHCVVLWSGDSRAYLFRNAKLSRLSLDHNNESRLIADGLSSREARAYPLAQALTHAVGVEQTLYLDARIQEVRQGDIYLLCSDGLNKEVKDLEIAAILSEGGSLADCQRRLMHTALQREARDNITVILARAC